MTSVKFGGGGLSCAVVGKELSLAPEVLRKGALDVSAYQSVMDGDVPFLLKYYCTPVHKTRKKESQPDGILLNYMD